MGRQAVTLSEGCGPDSPQQEPGEDIPAEQVWPELGLTYQPARHVSVSARLVSRAVESFSCDLFLESSVSGGPTAPATPL
jgi:hypothetical protein